MRRKSQCFASAVLSAALMAPVGAIAATIPQDDHDQHAQEVQEHRVYDAEHKAYRNWDKHEDEAYRHWLDGRHEAYVDYDHLDKKKQREYWKWRHEHDDQDHH